MDLQDEVKPIGKTLGVRLPGRSTKRLRCPLICYLDPGRIPKVDPSILDSNTPMVYGKSLKVDLLVGSSQVSGYGSSQMMSRTC